MIIWLELWSLFSRVIFLGLITSLSGSSYFFVIAVIVLLRKQFRKEAIKGLQQTHQGPVELPKLQLSEGSERCSSPSRHGGEVLFSIARRLEMTETPHGSPTSPLADSEKPGLVAFKQANGLTGVNSLESSCEGQQDTETRPRHPAEEPTVL